MSGSWAELLTSAWTVAIVPAAVAISALIAFWKTWVEKRNVELENRKLEIELDAAASRIIAPTDEQVERYGVRKPHRTYAFRSTFVRQTIRIGAMVLAVALPISLAIQGARTGMPTATVPPPVDPVDHTDIPLPPDVPPPNPPDPPKPSTDPSGRWTKPSRDSLVGTWAVESGARGSRLEVSKDSSVRLSFRRSWFREVVTKRIPRDAEGHWQVQADGTTVRIQVDSPEPVVLDCKFVRGKDAQLEGVCVTQNKTEWRLVKQRSHKESPKVPASGDK